MNAISPVLDRTILRAETLVMERRYDEASTLFRELERERPQSLLPSLGRLLILMTHYLEQNAPRAELDREFSSEFAANRRLLKTLSRRDDLAAWDHFLMGGSLGVRGLYEMEQGRYLPAFLHGLSALSHLEEARRLDPGIEDIYFATGLYKYFRSVKTRYLWFLPLIRDQREEGIAEIRRALARGRYAPPACKIALVVLARKQGSAQAQEGIAMGEAFLKEYPRCLLIRTALAGIYLDRGDREDAARIYRDGYGQDPSIRWVLLEAGRAFLLANLPDRAEASFRTYLGSDPSPAEAAQAHLGLSAVYEKEGEIVRARAEQRQALRLDPSIRGRPDRK